MHQEEINAFLKSVRDKSGVDFLAACMDFLDAKLDVHGLENLPEDGLCTFVSNHPLGGQDGVALGYLLGTHYNGRIKYLVNDLLMNLHGLAPLCIPINKTGSQSRDFPRMVEEGFRSDSHIIMFPAGICSRRQHGVIKDLAWKKRSLPRVLKPSAMLCLYILKVGILIFSTILPMPVSFWYKVQYRHAVSGRRDV